MTAELDRMRKARRQFREAREEWDDNREKMLNDLEFLNGDQWPNDIKADRDIDGRPCLTINRLPAFCDQVEGDQRQNKPAVKVRPVDSYGDPGVAKIYEGLIRHIEVSSQANVAYTNASSTQIAAGVGYLRVATDYVDDDIFDQDIKIKPVWNPFSIHLDPAAQEIDYTDARYLFVTTVIPRDEFESKFPGKNPQHFSENPTDDQRDWVETDAVRVAEWFCKEPLTKTIYLLADGSIVDELPSGITDEGILRQREVKSYKIVRRLIDGFQELEPAQDWPSKYYPIVPVWGKELNIQGKRHLRGLVRHAKDPQRLYNYNRSLGAETLALAPKAPYLATPKQIKNHEAQWKQAHKKNFPYLLYNPDPTAGPGPPQRQVPGLVQTGIIQEIGLANEELKSTTGIYDPSLGARTKEASGRAILALQREGDIATFAYSDNLARAMVLLGKILIDLIPKIYDTNRIVRILGEDGTHEAVGINVPAVGPNGELLLLNNLGVGKYDVSVTVGPSYATKRIEAADSMLKFIGAVPQAGPVIGHLIAKHMDWPGADQIAEQLQRLLPPGLAVGQGGPQGPGGQGQPPPMAPGPTPEQEQEGEMMEIKIEQEKAKLEQERLKADKLALEIEQMRAVPRET